MLHKNLMRNFDTQLIIIIDINEAIAYFAQGFFGFGGGKGSIPMSIALANISRSSSIVTMVCPIHVMP